jgi:hypothetical protein
MLKINSEPSKISGSIIAPEDTSNSQLPNFFQACVKYISDNGQIQRNIGVIL